MRVQSVALDGWPSNVQSMKDCTVLSALLAGVGTVGPLVDAW